MDEGYGLGKHENLRSEGDGRFGREFSNKGIWDPCGVLRRGRVRILDSDLRR